LGHRIRLDFRFGAKNGEHLGGGRIRLRLHWRRHHTHFGHARASLGNSMLAALAAARNHVDEDFLEEMIPATAIILPVTPRSARCEHNRSVRQDVQCGELQILCAGTPASSSWRRLASIRSRKMLTGSSLWPGARAVRNRSGYRSRTTSELFSSRNRSAAYWN